MLTAMLQEQGFNVSLTVLEPAAWNEQLYHRPGGGRVIWSIAAGRQLLRNRISFSAPISIPPRTAFAALRTRRSMPASTRSVLHRH